MATSSASAMPGASAGSSAGAAPVFNTIAPGPFNAGGAFQFRSPKPFSGKREDWEDFSWQLKAYLSLIRPHFHSVMDKAEKLQEPVGDSFCQNPDGSVNETLMEMSTSLHFILVNSCEGQAATFLKQCSEPNGFESWRQLHQRLTVLSLIHISEPTRPC